MHSTISNRVLVPVIATVALAGFYFISASPAEARVGSIGVERIASSTVSSSTKNRIVVTTCMSTAVETRETALMTAMTDLGVALATTLTERKTALVAAWSITDSKERAKALKTAWTDYKKSKKTAESEFKTDRKAAWDNFKKTAKTECKMTVPKEEAQEKAAKDSLSI